LRHCERRLNREQRDGDKDMKKQTRNAIKWTTDADGSHSHKAFA
jgi:hypothetical protein